MRTKFRKSIENYKKIWYIIKRKIWNIDNGGIKWKKMKII